MTYTVKLPDVGEGVTEAELVEWHVSIGDTVTPDTVLAEVLTDKATVEIYAPVAGTVAALHGQPGDVLAIGGDFVTLAATEQHTDPPPVRPTEPPHPAPVSRETSALPPATNRHDRPPVPTATASLEPPTALAAGPAASPAVRARAGSLGIDLTNVRGTGPNGRIEHGDLDRLLVNHALGNDRASKEPHAVHGGVTIEPVRGLRRKISERLTAAWREIPHITYVDAVDATELEQLRQTLNALRSGPKLTLLPFIARAIALAVADQPRLNAHYKADASTLTVFDAVHLGVATQTDAGLAVPVVRHADTLRLDEIATEIARLASATRANKATREELTGSSITITSLGALGGLATTPILNAPEVSIIGINKIETRPVWCDDAFTPRLMFNISASFDHRVIDGWDAATFVQRVRQHLETPSSLADDAAGPAVVNLRAGVSPQREG